MICLKIHLLLISHTNVQDYKKYWGLKAWKQRIQFTTHNLNVLYINSSFHLQPEVIQKESVWWKFLFNLDNCNLSLWQILFKNLQFSHIQIFTSIVCSMGKVTEVQKIVNQYNCFSKEWCRKINKQTHQQKHKAFELLSSSFGYSR